MADDSSPAVTSFAQYESAVKEGRFNPTPSAAPTEKAELTTAAPDETSASESATESETVDTQPVQSEKGKAGTAPAPPALARKPAQKLSLTDEHARLLREVVDLRKERRELQQQPIPSSPPAPQAGPVAATTPAPAGEADKPPARPRLSTFQGTLEEYEKAVETYEDDNRKFLERQWQRKQADVEAQAEAKKRTQAYGDALAEHLKAHPEYDEEIAQTPLSPLMVDIVLHVGPTLGQALIDDKAEAKRIQALPRDVQIFEMGKLSARLNGDGASALPAVSNEEPEPAAVTPQPVKIPAKVGASGGSAAVLNRPDHGAKNFAEFEAIERRLAKKGK